MAYLIVSRHPAAIAFIRAEAAEFASARIIESATPADVAGNVVAGNLPLHLAALAAQVVAVEFASSAPRGAEYGLDEMRAAGACLKRYNVTAVTPPPTEREMRFSDGRQSRGYTGERTMTTTNSRHATLLVAALPEPDPMLWEAAASAPLLPEEIGIVNLHRTPPLGILNRYRAGIDSLLMRASWQIALPDNDVQLVPTVYWPHCPTHDCWTVVCGCGAPEYALPYSDYGDREWNVPISFGDLKDFAGIDLGSRLVRVDGVLRKHVTGGGRPEYNLLSPIITVRGRETDETTTWRVSTTPPQDQRHTYRRSDAARLRDRLLVELLALYC